MTWPEARKTPLRTPRPLPPRSAVPITLSRRSPAASFATMSRVPSSPSAATMTS
jgi:hypothetical protein